MSWFLNLGMRSKLFLSFGLLIALLAAVSLVAYRGITAMQKSTERLYEEQFANATDLLSLRNNVNRMRAALLQIILTNEGSDREVWYQDMRDSSKITDHLIQRLLERNRDDSASFAKLEEFKGQLDAFSQVREQEIIPLLEANKPDEAIGLILGPQLDRYRMMRAIADELGEQAEANAWAAMALTGERAEQTVRALVGAGLISLLVGLGLVLFLGWITTGPLRSIAVIGERVAARDLTVAIPFNERRDEIGNLAHSFRKMVESFRTTHREIQEGTHALASAVNQILATTTQQAASVAETTTAVSETTTTIEEVKQTAQMSSEKAKKVSETAQKAAHASQAGRKSVEETLAAIERAQNQMESIAESIVRLSEQTQAIGEIVATVNDLAEQSNLLAVNASIEASKAGEHGKGFTVVAQEIKSLAEQSKQATTQVRAILNDIQKATSGVVMAAEQGSRAVEAGVKQTDEASVSIKALADIVTTATQAAMQIAASSQQQLVGMDQVALAMENIKQASAQNEAGSKQSEAAAHNLHALGQKLKHLAEQYKV